MPAVDIFIPKRLNKAWVIRISANAEIITAAEGTAVLKIMKTTIAMKINAIRIAIKSCL